MIFVHPITIKDMHTYIELLSGSEKGLTYKIRPGLRLGSNEGGLRINDPSIPPLHSQVLLDHKNQMVLVCTNAVYEVFIGGRAIKKVVLLDGIIMQIGNILLKVSVTNKELIGALDPLAPKQETQPVFSRNWLEPEQTIAIATRIVQPDSPKTALVKELRRLLGEFKNPPLAPSFHLFKHPIRLRVETGPQADDEYVLSWGPREFGPMALEFPLEFPPFPGILFTLSPSESGEILFSTKHPDFARVSGHTDSTCVIEDGNKIEAGNSTILVELLEDNLSHD